MEAEVVIVGAGIAGLAAAVALKRVGVRALVLEKAKSWQVEGATLTLFPNAWHALDALALSHKLLPVYAPCYKEYITNIDNGTIEEISFVETDHMNLSRVGLRVVHRKTLLKALADELPNGTIRFSTNLTSIETQQQDGSSIAIIHMSNGIAIKAKALIGCDGVHSVVAQRLGLPKPIDSGRWAIRGLAIFPQGHGLNYELQQFVTKAKSSGFVPLNDKELYWFMFLNGKSLPKGKAREMVKNPKLVQSEVIENHVKDLPPLYSLIVEHSDLSTLTCNPIKYRRPWDVLFGNICEGNITLAGDAMHPMTPDLGQNECAALEDAVVLANHIANSMILPNKCRSNATFVSKKVVRALSEYAQERKWRVSVLISVSYMFGMEKEGGFGFCFMKMLVGLVFARFFCGSVFDILHYNCGKLSCVCDEEKEVGF